MRTHDVLEFDADSPQHTEALTTFCGLFAADPERVAELFADWSVSGDDYCFDHPQNEGSDLSDEDSYAKSVIAPAGVIGLVEVLPCDDGDEDGLGLFAWTKYRLSTDALRGISKLGARRWIERFLPKEAPALASMPTGQLTREEILAAVDFSYVTAVEGVLGQLEGVIGTGETPRTVDRGMVTELLIHALAQRVVRLYNQRVEMDNLLSGIESSAAAAREILSGERG